MIVTAHHEPIREETLEERVERLERENSMMHELLVNIVKVLTDRSIATIDELSGYET